MSDISKQARQLVEQYIDSAIVDENLRVLLPGPEDEPGSDKGMELLRYILTALDERTQLQEQLRDERNGHLMELTEAVATGRRHRQALEECHQASSDIATKLQGQLDRYRQALEKIAREGWDIMSPMDIAREALDE